MAAAPQVAGSARQAARVALHKVRPLPTASRPVKKHEKLAKTLEWLNKEPKPILERINRLELTYAYKNNHFGARYVNAHRVLRSSCWGPQLSFRRVMFLRMFLFFFCACVSLLL